MERRRTYRLLGKNVDVLFSEGTRDMLKWLGGLEGTSFFVLDSKVAEFLVPEGIPGDFVAVKGGDSMKSAEQLMEIRDRAIDAGITSGSRFVVIGGGVSIDLTATCICAYFHGAEFIAVPTTVMAMTDGTLGGRCGINQGEKRYVCRDRCQADRIVIEADFLAKAGDGNNRNGFGEVMKHALLSPSPKLFDTLMSVNRELLGLKRETIEDVILQSMDIKASFLHVAEDNPVAETVLELGHHFGFAFMADGGEGGLKHGEAVVWGMARAIALGVRKGMTDRRFADKASALFALYQYDTAYRFPKNRAEKLLELWSETYGIEEHDLVLLEDRGKPVLYRADDEEINSMIS